MTILELTKNAINYGKNLSSPGIYLSNCYDILDNEIEETEEDVLKIDERLHNFFNKNIEFPIVIELKQQYNKLKEAHLEKNKLKRKECTLSKENKLNNKLESYNFYLQNFTENRLQILEARHLTEKQLNSEISETKRNIDEIENDLENMENHCQMHGLEVNFENDVIEPMKEYINQKRKESF